MSKLRLRKFHLIIGWGIMAIFAAKPTVAQESKLSTKAKDLLSPGVERSQYFTDIQTRTYQLAQLDLEKFCQDFPDNSRCRGTTIPGSTEEPNSIPVPAPPPAPPEETVSNNAGQKTGWAIVPEISTLGLGGHVVTRIIPQINARVGINTFSLGLDDLVDTDIDYEADLNLFNVSTLVDVHPFKNSGFRLSSGLIFANNNLEASADATDTVVDELEEQSDLDEDTIERLRNINDLANLDADVDITNSVSPYLGIGGGNAVGKNKGLGFWWNLGVVFGGSPSVDLDTDVAIAEVRAEFEGDTSSENVERIIEETQAAVDEVIDDEEEDIEDELDFVKIYPVLSLGISYQF